MFLQTLPLFVALTLTAVVLTLFKDYRLSAAEWLRPAMGASLLVAAACIFLREDQRRASVAIAVALALLWLRSRRVEADVAEGVLTGATIGGGAALIVTAAPRAECSFAALVGSAALAGVIAYAVSLRLRRSRFALALVNVAFVFIALPILSDLAALDPRTPVIVICGAALIALVTILLRWPMLRRELREEANLGVLPDEDVHWIANPFTRLMPQGWADQRARREFVRVATDLAVRRARQRRMPAEQARLHQLEVLRVRGLLQELYSVELSMRRPAAASLDQPTESNTASDTLRSARTIHRPDAKG